jgi:hypothetical protein
MLTEWSTDGLLLDRGGGSLNTPSLCEYSSYVADLNSRASETECGDW